MARREVILAAGSINVAAAADAFRHRTRWRSSPSWACRSCTTARASAGICRTIWNSISRWTSTQPITLYSVMILFAKALIGVRWLALPTGSGRPTISRVAASSVAAPASNGPTSSTISCRRHRL